MTKRTRVATRTRPPGPPPWTPFEFTRFANDPGTGAPEAFFANSRYVAIAVLPIVGWVGAHGDYDVHLSIRRQDREAESFPWRDLQRMKSELCGSEAEAVEVFPAESRLLDASNQRHLWVRRPGRTWDVGLDGGRTVLDGAMFDALVADPVTAAKVAAASNQSVADVASGRRRGRQAEFEDGMGVNLGHDGIVWPYIGVMQRAYRERLCRGII